VGLGSALALLNTSQGLARAGERSDVPTYPACTTTADEAALQAARGAFEAGKAAFNEADYARAIIYWEDAFRRDCSASLLLKNLGRAYEANGQFAHAVVALTTYLERDPNTLDRAELEAQIAHLKDQPTTTTAPVPAKAEPTGGQAAAKPSGNSATPPTVAAERDTPPPGAEVEGASGSANVAPIVLAAVGAAVAVAGGVFWWGAHSDEVEAQNECPTRVGCPVGVEKLGNEAIDRQLRWGLVAGGGLILLGGGVAWYLLQPSENAAFIPSVGPDYAGLQFSGNF
jgi:hypothetical protein